MMGKLYNILLSLSTLKAFWLPVALFVLVSFAWPQKAAATTPGTVTINEIAWAGSTASANDEWLELYNNGPDPVDLNGWILRSLSGKINIKLTGQIPGYGFYLLERTDDSSVPGILADKIYTGALLNQGDALELDDNNGSISDKTDCSSGWFGGNNSTKQTMARINPSAPGNNPLNWGSSQKPDGTPKGKNLMASPLPLPPGPEKTISRNAEADKAINKASTFAAGVVSEKIPSPTEKPFGNLFSSALLIAIILGASVLVLKKLIRN